jgi:PKD repeat protein
MPFKTWIAAASLTLATSVALAQSDVPHREKPAFPGIDLPERARGERAVQLLGARLSELAAYYGMTAGELARILREDRRAVIDRTGRFLFEDELDAPLESPGVGTSDSLTLSGALAPLDQTFVLHSRPGAKRTIYLDFNGATLSGTAWNTAQQPTIFAEPFDLDGVPGTFSTTELQRIQYIWQRVAEDYAPFDVDVTTEAPSADRLTRSSTSDDIYGTTVLITRRTFYNCSCGGVAYVGIFDNVGDSYKPALVFYDMLGSGNEKYVAEAISHEAGHNMGLSHDGTPSTGYYQGHGSGVTGWAPIMGVGYYQPLVQWSKGEYANANQTQDEYVVMQSNGLPLRTDDHGGMSGAATALAGTSAGGITSFVASGVVERPTDVDFFSFVADAGTISFSVAPASRSPNLDALIELRNSSGVLLASSNPADALDGSVTYNAAAGGTFYVAVKGTGKGDALTTGYTSYGSLGEYKLSGSATQISGTPPVAVLSASQTSGTAPITINFSSSGSSDPDGSIAGYEWNFGDGAPVATTANNSHTYATPGVYTVTLKVIDNSGLSAAQSTTITVQQPVVAAKVHVDGITVRVVTQKGGQANAEALVTVRDDGGNLIPGAGVTGTWSGLTSGTASAVTNSAGTAVVKSARTKASSGIFTFTVTGITLSGYTYDTAANEIVSASATR